MVICFILVRIFVRVLKSCLSAKSYTIESSEFVKLDKHQGVYLRKRAFCNWHLRKKTFKSTY